MGERYEGEIIGFAATVGVRADALDLSIAIPWDQLDGAKQVRDSVVLRLGENLIWFSTSEPDALVAELEGLVPTGDEAVVEPPKPPPVAPPPVRSRWRRPRP